MLYEIFYYMVFTCQSAGKIWSPIYTQDIVKPGSHYEINLTRFLYHLFDTNLVKIITYMFRTQRRIKNSIKHLRWSFL